MIVFGLISPHPPIIIPDIGKDDLNKVQKTVSSLEKASSELGAAKPDQLIIISPHDDHGFDVPEFYLAKHLPPETPVKEILVTEPSYHYYYEFGRELGKDLAAKSDRYAIVASGDLSHVLTADGPYGFNKSGPVLDQLINDAVSKNDAEALLKIDPQVLADGAECGLRSIMFLLGALTNTDFKPNVLSYEGPFGVGYMVTTYQPAKKSQPASKPQPKKKAHATRKVSANK